MKASPNFFSYSLFTGNLNSLPTKSAISINTINQYSFCVAENDSTYKKALKASSVLLPDGIGVVWAARLLTGIRIKKIAGTDVHLYYLDQLNRDFGRCFYLGASKKTLLLIKKELAINYPNIAVGSFSPPYKDRFNDEENRRMINAVNDFKPDVLFVGMTAPKQEKWVFENRKALQVRVVCTIGAVFDFYAGIIKRPSAVWINYGLEWLGRLLKEPNRLSKRYLYYGPIFLYRIILAKLKGNRNLDLDIL